MNEDSRESPSAVAILHLATDSLLFHDGDVAFAVDLHLKQKS